ncbi:MAG: hypothetical protein C4519_05705 [Desulfobacteraceae bacterium]|nr:MAG: hypothetical protein C4519_05705 [Desulfobacteraceae bacterium]
MLCSNDVHRTISLLMVLFTCLVFTHATAWGAEDYVGRVAQIKGTVTIQRGSATLAVAKDTLLKNEDTLSTGPDGSIGIVFDDETTLSLGPGSKLIVQEYAFDPDRSNFALVLQLLTGTAAYVSGLIAKLSPDTTRFITPAASIGVRGTKFVIAVDEV